MVNRVAYGRRQSRDRGRHRFINAVDVTHVRVAPTAWCVTISDRVQNEMYDELGVSAWKAMPWRVAQWVLEHSNGMVRISLLPVFAGLLGMFWLLENPCVVAALVVGAMVLVMRRKTKTGA